ncbi:hypothetical protein OUZ56_014279 [Daphnia magna]|uniref:Uncharacterized protein n=1 Tax=Daphnia magna TaxID=35525 RepID=A0ABR0AJC7_9CRUS|nr:hypothetical protein OUZ56_014279 [Daphnia magna]
MDYVKDHATKSRLCGTCDWNGNLQHRVPMSIHAACSQGASPHRMDFFNDMKIWKTLRKALIELRFKYQNE